MPKGSNLSIYIVYSLLMLYQRTSLDPVFLPIDLLIYTEKHMTLLGSRERKGD